MALKISEMILFGTITALVIMLIMSAKIEKDPPEPERPSIIIEEVD